MTKRKKNKRKVIAKGNIGPLRMEYRWWEFGMGPIKGVWPILEFKLNRRRR